MQSSAGYAFLRQGKVRDVYSTDNQHHLLIIADTKFEFGMADGELILIDELFTPDSSRFWPADSYLPGTSPLSFDKQFVRDFLEKIKWDKQLPAPSLPEDVIYKTSEKYQEALKRLTGGPIIPAVTGPPI